MDLLRHGYVEGGPCYRGITDDPLSAAGWEQMWAAVSGDIRWDGIVTSPLTRCAAFARALAEQRALPLQIDARLQEMNFGRWEGRTAAQLLETDADALTGFWQDPWNRGPPGGESLAQVRARVLDAWGDIVAQRRRLLVVAHGGPIRVILCHVLNHPLAKLLEIDVPYAALRRIDVPMADTPENQTP
ncbi:MAG: alpha-ribazole phosphatase family protein [Gammaproteobacteria bacterium]|nr:alpha-ribazole phosphatase family protein [Gammaproteobacteria bacterium]